MPLPSKICLLCLYKKVQDRLLRGLCLYNKVQGRLLRGLCLYNKVQGRLLRGLCLYNKVQGRLLRGLSEPKGKSAHRNKSHLYPTVRSCFDVQPAQRMFGFSVLFRRAL